jgi:hypothetical protein
MLSPDNPHARYLISHLVRHIASDTGFTTLARIGEVADDLFALRDTYMHGPDIDYDELLAIATLLEPGQPTPGPVAACALVLPDGHIAYIKHATAPMSTLTVGPDPHDDPDTHRAADAGLTAVMHIHLDRQPTSRPTGRAFPTIRDGRMPNTSRRHPTRPVDGRRRRPIPRRPAPAGDPAIPTTQPVLR